MTTRITNADIRSALERLSRALDAAGCPVPPDRDLDLRAPYGQVFYVVSHSIDEKWKFEHDVPGFRGSNMGFTSKRDAYEAICQTARTLFDFDYAMDAWRPGSQQRSA